MKNVLFPIIYCITTHLTGILQDFMYVILTFQSTVVDLTQDQPRSVVD